MKKAILILLVSVLVSACSSEKGSFDDVTACIGKARGGEKILKDWSKFEQCAETNGWEVAEVLAYGINKMNELN